MTSIVQIVYQFLTFEGINQAYVAQQLYGNKGPTARAKLHNKLYNTDNRSFSEAELERLMEIRREFLSRLL